jgi:CheY-like chemotaxis protein
MNYNATTPFRILIADDDEDDVQMTKECFIDNKLAVDVNEVGDGQYLMDHLQSLKSTHGKDFPQLIILDLNMPRKNGLETLKELKEDNMLCRIPVVVFSTSKAPGDIEKAYELGASCFVSKPNSLDEWCDKIAKLGKFWVECVRVAPR